MTTPEGLTMTVKLCSGAKPLMMFPLYTSCAWKRHGCYQYFHTHFNMKYFKSSSMHKALLSLLVCSHLWQAKQSHLARPGNLIPSLRNNESTWVNGIFLRGAQGISALIYDSIFPTSFNRTNTQPSVHTPHSLLGLDHHDGSKKKKKLTNWLSGLVLLTPKQDFEPRLQEAELTD